MAHEKINLGKFRPVTVFLKKLLLNPLLYSAIYFVFLSYFSVTRHYRCQTQMNDLGNMTQAIYQASKGKLDMPTSNDTDGKLRSRLGIHSNYIFIPIGLIFRMVQIGR